LQEAVDFSQETGVSLINLSTGLKPQIPDVPNFRFIEAPNAAIDVVQFMIDLEKDAERFQGWIKTIIEHHQVAKTSLPGTAVEMARMLGVNKDDRVVVSDWEAYKAKHEVRTHGGIISVRDWKGSKAEYQIPDEYQGGYGIHRITLHNPESGVTVERGGTQVLGRRAYAEGTYRFVRALEIAPDQIPLGVTNVVDFVRNRYHELAV
jgi:4-hydroxy-tetrahydrodipicolinate reductase